jgi:hypothetical protein
MKIDHAPPSPEATRTWEALRGAVAKKLDEKRRLGHYYVVWRDGRAEFIGADAPTDNDPRASDAPDR